MGDAPVTVAVDLGSDAMPVNIGCEAVSDRCLAGYLALYEPAAFTPAFSDASPIFQDDVVLITQDRVLSIEGDREYVEDLLGRSPGPDGDHDA